METIEQHVEEVANNLRRHNLYGKGCVVFQPNLNPYAKEVLELALGSLGSSLFYKDEQHPMTEDMYVYMWREGNSPESQAIKSELNRLLELPQCKCSHWFATTTKGKTHGRSPSKVWRKCTSAPTCRWRNWWSRQN